MILRLTFHFLAQFRFFTNNQSLSFLFILNSLKAGPGQTNQVPDWLRRFPGESLCCSMLSFNRRVYARLERMVIETVERNNSERIIKKLWYRDGVYRGLTYRNERAYESSSSSSHRNSN